MLKDARWKNVWASVTEEVNPYDQNVPMLEFYLEVDGYFVRSYQPKLTMDSFMGENFYHTIFEILIHRIQDAMLLGEV